jgi:pterin-4a-carbinolamine dehydratase
MIALTAITHLLFVLIRNALKEFWGNFNQTYIFVNPVSADAVTFQTDIPTLDKIKRKVVIVLKTRQMKAEEFLDVNAAKDIMMMEANRSILENIFNVCQVSLCPPLLRLCELLFLNSNKYYNALLNRRCSCQFSVTLSTRLAGRTLSPRILWTSSTTSWLTLM